MNALIHAHSGLRWIALALLILAIFNAFLGGKKGVYEKKDKMINLFAMVILHIQLLIGFVLYFKSGKVRFVENWMSSENEGGMYRFFNLEHVLLMLIAIVLVTLGRKKAEKATVVSDKHKKIVVWYSIALILIIASIPWPFREALKGQWF
jgi:hypothetical protein